MTYIKNKTIQNYVHNVDTSITKEVISTTIEYYPGTEVTYTPPASASSVIYECNLQSYWNPDGMRSYLCSRLQYSDDNGSSWNDIVGCKMLEGTSGNVADYDVFNFNWMFLLPAWSGERKLRVAGRSYNTASEYTIGKVWLVSGSEGVSCPHVSVYSII